MQISARSKRARWPLRRTEAGQITCDVRRLDSYPCELVEDELAVLAPHGANNYYPEPDSRFPSSTPTRPPRPSCLPPSCPIPVAGDDANAKRTVNELIDQIGFTGVDAGTLAESRRQQPGSLVYAAHVESRRQRTRLTASRLQELLSASPISDELPLATEGQ